MTANAMRLKWWAPGLDWDWQQESSTPSCTGQTSHWAPDADCGQQEESKTPVLVGKVVGRLSKMDEILLLHKLLRLQELRH